MDAGTNRHDHRQKQTCFFLYDEHHRHQRQTHHVDVHAAKIFAAGKHGHRVNRIGHDDQFGILRPPVVAPRKLPQDKREKPKQQQVEPRSNALGIQHRVGIVHHVPGDEMIDPLIETADQRPGNKPVLIGKGIQGRIIGCHLSVIRKTEQNGKEK